MAATSGAVSTSRRGAMRFGRARTYLRAGVSSCAPAIDANESDTNGAARDDRLCLVVAESHGEFARVERILQCPYVERYSVLNSQLVQVRKVGCSLRAKSRDEITNSLRCLAG